jgi:outer membrane autotransporter protein
MFVSRGLGNLYGERGLTFGWRSTTIQSYSGLQHIYARQGNVQESGTSDFALDVGGIDAHSLRSVLGSRLSLNPIFTQRGLLTPELRTAWMHEFLDTNHVTNIGLTSFGGSTVPIRGLDLGRDWATVGGGFSLFAHRGLRLIAGYDIQFNSHQAFQFGSGGLEFVW